MYQPQYCHKVWDKAHAWYSQVLQRQPAQLEDEKRRLQERVLELEE